MSISTIPTIDSHVEDLVMRIAAPQDREAIAELAARVGSSMPDGALMVGELDGALLAAVSMSTGEAVTEQTVAGAAAAAVIRYRVAHLSPRRSTPVAAVAA
jgi:hypothetical protein